MPSESLSFNRLPSKRMQTWHVAGLVTVLGLSAFLNFYRLDQEGFANLYYAATVRSTLSNWSNFFFVSFDPGGFVSVDKPPLGFWIQAASAALFGFQGWSLLLPQALAGVFSVGLLYYLVSRIFGHTSGLIAGLVLALTPISVATNRNNTMDSLLVLTSLLAADTASLAVEQGKLRWLLLCALLVGIGFNIKMLQAYLVLPAFFLVYLLAAPISIWRRIWRLAIATALLAVVSFSWAAAVDLTPVDRRPYVGGSTDNTVLELVLGHNGVARLGRLGRLFGLEPNPGGPSKPDGQSPARPGPYPYQNSPAAPIPLETYPVPGVAPPQGYQPLPPASQPLGPAPRGMINETGIPGGFRLLNPQLAGQISWLLPMALFSIIPIARPRRWKWPLDPQLQALLLWSFWLIPQVIFFSYAGLFHRHYLEMMSPAIAALVGVRVTAMWEDFRSERVSRGIAGWLLPLALFGSAGIEMYILWQHPQWLRWLAPIILGFALFASLGLVWLKVNHQILASQYSNLSNGFTVLGLLALLIAPAVWSAFPVYGGGDGALPFAGPELLDRRKPGADQDLNRLIGFLLKSRDGEKWILATPSAQTASPIILATGEPVMALGGFSGGDQILTVAELEVRIDHGVVRFFLLPEPSLPANSPARQGQPILPVQPFIPLPVNPPGQGKPAIPFPSNQPGPNLVPPVRIPGLAPVYPPGGIPGISPVYPPAGPSPIGKPDELIIWVHQNCRPVPDGLWNPRINPPNSPGERQILWDCGS